MKNVDELITHLPERFRINPSERALTEKEQDKMMYHFGHNYVWSMSLHEGKIYFGPVVDISEEEGLEAWGYITLEQLNELEERPVEKVVKKKVVPKRSSHLTNQKWYKNLMDKIK